MLYFLAKRVYYLNVHSKKLVYNIFGHYGAEKLKHSVLNTFYFS